MAFFSELVSDRHPSFTGKLTRLLTEACGIRHILISPYHSQSNGQCEKMNDIVLQGLRVHCQGLKNWPQLLAPIAAAYRAATLLSRKASPFRIMYGVEMRLPVETMLCKLLPAHERPTDNIDTMSNQLTLMRLRAQRLAQESRERGAKAANQNRITPEFNIGDKVYKTKDSLATDQDRKTAPKFEGPFTVVDRGPNNVYKLANFYTGTELRNYVHVDKLKSSVGARAARRQTRTVDTSDAQCPDFTQLGAKKRKTCDGTGTPGRDAHHGSRSDSATQGASESAGCGKRDEWVTREEQRPTMPGIRHIGHPAPGETEHDNKENTTPQYEPKLQRHTQTAPDVDTDNDRNDFHVAFGTAGLDLDFDSDLLCERGTPEQLNSVLSDTRRHCRRTGRKRKGRGTPHFPYGIIRPRRPVGSDRTATIKTAV